ncbi:MAG: hypothetical protein JSR77_13230 [Planctomycetes bacterium]|nr:hypothetical protein [Planctomycetota bacterium]
MNSNENTNASTHPSRIYPFTFYAFLMVSTLIFVNAGIWALVSPALGR